MGWDVTQVGSNITTKKYIEYYIKTSYNDSYEIVKIVEGKNNFGEKAFYVAAVKVIGEALGPAQIEAPANFIYLLSPTENEWAKQWRADCINRYISTKILKEEVA
jgi:hypothetical protein